VIFDYLLRLVALIFAWTDFQTKLLGYLQFVMGLVPKHLIPNS